MNFIDKYYIICETQKEEELNKYYTEKYGLSPKFNPSSTKSKIHNIMKKMIKDLLMRRLIEINISNDGIENIMRIKYTITDDHNKHLMPITNEGN